MPLYRLYRLNAKGRIDSPAHLAEYDSDDEAIITAKVLLHGTGQAEVWQEKRFIGCVVTSENNPR